MRSIIFESEKQLRSADRQSSPKNRWGKKIKKKRKQKKKENRKLEESRSLNDRSRLFFVWRKREVKGNKKSGKKCDILNPFLYAM